MKDNPFIQAILEEKQNKEKVYESDSEERKEMLNKNKLKNNLKICNKVKREKINKWKGYRQVSFFLSMILYTYV